MGRGGVATRRPADDERHPGGAHQPRVLERGAGVEYHEVEAMPTKQAAERRWRDGREVGLGGSMSWL